MTRSIAAVPVRATALVALGLLLVAAVGALVVSLAAAEGTRDWLGYSFEEQPPRAGDAVAILANNLRLLAGVFAACAVAQLAAGAPRIDEDGPSARLAAGVGGALTWICDVAVACSAIVQALLVGVSVGAYGDRLFTWLLPHGPFELLAYSIALALYVEARRRRIPLRRWVASAALSVGALALGAPLEVFLTP